MNSSMYLACDLEDCRQKSHRFKTTWSDKTPMKMSLMCVTCSELTGKNAYVAYANPARLQDGFGQFRRRKIDEPQGINILD